MKIVLISPYPDITSFGLRTISAHLRRHGHRTRLVFVPDALGDDLLYGVKRYEDHVLDELIELCRDADLIGITLMTNFFDGAVQITERLKSAGVKAPVIWGGVHPTIRPEESLEHADIVCVGDGEDALLELADPDGVRSGVHRDREPLVQDAGGHRQQPRASAGPGSRRLPDPRLQHGGPPRFGRRPHRAADGRADAAVPRERHGRPVSAQDRLPDHDRPGVPAQVHLLHQRRDQDHLRRAELPALALDRSRDAGTPLGQGSTCRTSGSSGFQTTPSSPGVPLPSKSSAQPTRKKSVCRSPALPAR